METQYECGRFASQAPAWNKDEGIFCVVNKEHGDTYVRTPPNIKIICEPLMGISVQTEDGWRATYLPREDQVALYTKAFQIVSDWNVREGLFNLALYRRQIDGIGPVPVDEAFVRMALEALPSLTAAEWKCLEQRMPRPSFIHGFCRMKAQGERIREAERIAAE